MSLVISNLINTVLEWFAGNRLQSMSFSQYDIITKLKNVFAGEGSQTFHTVINLRSILSPLSLLLSPAIRS